MTNIVLPKLNQTGANEWADVQDNDEAIKKVVNGELTNGNLSGSAGITAANLAASAKPFTWYTPKIIATEQSRENTSYGTLTTADEIANVVLPGNGLMAIGYAALVKSSVSGAGTTALFIGANQLKVAGGLGGAPPTQGVSTTGTTLHLVSTGAAGLASSNAESSSMVTTGQVLGNTDDGLGGLCYVFAATGTYNVSVQFKASSGSITAKERKLWVAVLGV